ncbi:MAG: putative rane protein [Herbinix sp.]|jgi:thiamine transporter|nr:putative rane protein [Herbinix sp.]
MFKKIFDLLVVTDVEAGSYYPTVAGNIALFVVIALLFLAMFVFSGSGKKKVNAKQLAFSAVAVALSVVTSMFAVFSLPFGGSITLFRMFFICLIGYFYGTRAGILTGIACGFLDLILKPYVVHPVQLLIDYPLAFGCLGLSGVFAKSKLGLIKGYILGVAGRYICHVLSGVIFFAMYAGGKNPMIYSLGYNATYIVPEAVVTLILLMLPPVIAAINMVKRQVTE